MGREKGEAIKEHHPGHEGSRGAGCGDAYVTKTHQAVGPGRAG